MKYVDNNFLIFDSENIIRGDDLSSDTLDDLFYSDKFSIKCYPKTKMLIPYLDSIKGEDFVNIKGFYILYKNIKNNSEAFLKTFNQIDLEVFKTLISVAEAIEYRTNNEKIYNDISEYMVGDIVTIQEYNKQKAISPLKYASYNHSLNQKSEFDKLFIELPPSSTITSFIDKNVASIPKMNDICKPYPSPLYFTIDIGKIIDSAPNKRLEVIRGTVKRLAEMDISIGEAEKLLNKFQILPKECVYGDTINDDLEIQVNEKDYYDALIEFIKYHINLYNSSALTEMSREELDIKNKSDFDTCNLPRRLEAYLESLLSYITRYHYNHVGKFKIDKSIYADDEDIEDSSGSTSSREDETQIGYETNHRGSDADIDIKGYIQMSGFEYGASVWAEAIVKLCRWGTRKPCSLLVGEGNQNVIDLRNMEVKTSVINLLNAKKILDSQNRSYYLESYSTKTFIRNDIAQEMPSVFVLREEYTNPANEEEIIYVRSAISVHDLVKEYLAGREFISGIDCADGLFYTDDDVDVVPHVESSSLLGLNSIQNIPSFVEFCDKNDIVGARTMSHALIHHESLNVFVPNTEDYLGHIAAQLSTVRNNVLYGCWIDIFDKTAIDSDIASLSEFLEFYTENVYKQFESMFYNHHEDQISISVLSKSSMFTNMIAEENIINEEVQDDEEEIELRLYEGDVSKIVFTQMMNRMGKSTDTEDNKPMLVGGICETDDGFTVFASIYDKDVTFDPTAKSISYINKSTRILGAALGDTVVDNNCRLVSKNTLRDIFNLLVNG